MKTLLLLRHAKSDWSRPDLRDHDRVLSPRGERACRRIGAYLLARSMRPDLVITSTARRALETARGVASVWDPSPRIEEDASLYLATAADMLRSVRSMDSQVRTLLMVAHHPGIRDLAMGLRVPPRAGDPDPLSGKFPTAGLARLSFRVNSWRDVAASAGVLESFVSPRELG